MTELRWHMFDGVIKFGYILCHYKLDGNESKTDPHAIKGSPTSELPMTEKR